MNEKKVCFIYCVNDTDTYRESVRYINHLQVPNGFEVDIIAIQKAPGICSAYNKAISQSDAKYKVYLHQDVFIVNPDFMKQVIELFKKNNDLGLLGVIGSKTMPESGVWWESNQKAGRVYDSHTGKMDLIQFDDPHASYEKVCAIDGLIMITQYDLPWREDLFDGWHYYDLSQSQEFILNGYQVGIVRQETPWCVHDCGIVNVKNGFFDAKKRFLEYYL